VSTDGAPVLIAPCCCALDANQRAPAVLTDLKNKFGRISCTMTITTPLTENSVYLYGDFREFGTRYLQNLLFYQQCRAIGK
jgi:hypothetical protein